VVSFFIALSVCHRDPTLATPFSTGVYKSIGDHYLLRMKSFLAGALVATVISAGVTYAVASTSSETITACAHKKTGDLRIMTGQKCKKSERAVSWSAGAAQAAQGASGPKGDTGAPGTQGAPGTDGLPGSNGVSQMYVSSFTGGYTDPGDGWELMEIFPLPTGSFLVIFSFRITFSGGTIHDAECRLLEVSNATDEGNRLNARTTTNGSILTIQNHYVLTSPGEVNVECISLGDSQVNVAGNSYAIQTDSVLPPLPPCARGENHGDAVTAAC